jgi:integrase
MPFFDFATYGFFWLIAAVNVAIRYWRGTDKMHTRYNGYPLLCRLLPSWRETSVKYLEAVCVIFLGAGLAQLSKPLGDYVMVAAGFVLKGASKQLMTDLERALARGERGLIDPFGEHKRKLLSEHVTDYVADLTALGRDAKYVDNCRRRLNGLIAACGWKTLAHVSSDGFSKWRERIPKLTDGRPEIGPRTQNQYLEAMRSFCNWCVKRKRCPVNPLADLQKADETADVRRARRALTVEQVATLLEAVPTVHQTVYRFFLTTGLRRQEAEDLCWGDLHLGIPTPFIKLRAKLTKSRRADSIPLRADLAEELGERRGDAGDADRVFNSVPTIEEHRAYLTAAKIDWEDSEGRRADVHALRHTYGTLLSNAGVAPREAMELMRHTDLRLTMKVYTDPRIFNLAGAVERLPMPASSVARVAKRVANSLSERQSPAVTGKTSSEGGELEVVEEKELSQPLAATDAEWREGEKNSAGRTRTYNQSVNSRLLYH